MSLTSNPILSENPVSFDNVLVFETLKRNYEITETFIEHQQVSDQMQRTTDVNLICSDGVIPVHAAILQAVSPFFDKIFSGHGQGHHYFGMCPVLLPDYSIYDFKKVVELIYYGKTNTSSVQDAEDIKEILTYFEIKISPIEVYQPNKNEVPLSSKSILTYPLETAAEVAQYIRAESLPQTVSGNVLLENSTEAKSNNNLYLQDNVLVFETLKRNYEITETFIEHQQVSDQMQRTTDVNLICSDGVIHVHAAILQAVSPFFDKIFSGHGQGHHYFGMCPVLLPDYSIYDFKKVVELIYYGKTNTSSVQDAEDIKEILTYFEIKISPIEVYQPNKIEVPLSSKSILTYPLETAAEVAQYIRAESLPQTVSGNVLLENSTEAKSNSSKNLRPRNTHKKHAVESATDSDYEGELQQKRRKFRQTKPSELNVSRNVQPSSGSYSGPGVNKDRKSKSASESSDDEINDSIYTDMEWFLNESKRCQHCGEQCKTAAAVSICLTSHLRLRCYYCFKVVKNTEKLFQHFAEKHKQAGRENCLMCPFCEQTIPYKSVSCHVISMHLQNPVNKKGTEGNEKAGRSATYPTPVNLSNNKNKSGLTSPGRTTTKKRTKNMESSEESGTKNEEVKEVNEFGKLKVSKTGNSGEEEKDKLLVRDLNFVIRRQSICTGKIRVFSLKKLRCALEVAQS